MKFKLPETLDGLSVEELAALAAQADAEFDELAPEPGASPTAEALADLTALNDASKALTERINELRTEEADRAAAAQALLEARTARAAETVAEPEAAAAEPEPEPEPAADNGGDGGAEVVAEAETITAEAAEPALTASTGPAGSPFKGLAARTGKTPAKVAAPAAEVGFEMRPQTPKYQAGVVGYKELATVLDSMAVSTRIQPNRAPHRERGHMIPMSLATLDRGFSADRIVTADSDIELSEQVDAIVAASTYYPNKFDETGALTASAGWCSPSELRYDFCGVDPATDLATLPDMNISRGGVRRPIDPDFTELYNTLPWRFTEAELMAEPNPTKPCIEIPCTEFEEIRAEAIGLCVTAGILQRRGYPELIERFMQEVMKAHQIKVSLWTLQDMVAGSTAITVPANSTLGAAGSILNSLALRAVLIRQKERIGHNAIIEGKAPSWLLKAAAADMAYQQGVDVKSVTDATVDGWLAARNIRIEWVGHWQNLPDNATHWPTTAQVLLYPSGAWFRHLANVIEVGTLYEKALLQQNRYMELFTEDEYLVDNRCKVSEAVTIPICVNGEVGAREALVCAATVNEVQTVTITGSPTGGHFTLTFGGDTTANIGHNASAAHVQSVLAALPSIGAGNVAVTGSAAAGYAVTFQGALGATNVPLMTADGSTLTGGTAPAVNVVQTTAGAPN
ncbi:major capsid protein [Nocardia cyriacigeorgica]|uniref:major capsid protein n=1 Tax=Nocardia cyriacigeorgica TaxID=135487 RepID=UPI00189306A9|nr:major capsid protein [Nocardia cyriacigeorgica]MBF6416977.1 major capsid protein [Nocardia cyriacigeorgica]